MKKYKTLATVLGIGLNVISGIFTVKLMWAFATSGMGKIIFAVFGVLMQATMAACAVFAVHCFFQGQAVRAIPAAVIYTGLLLLSFCGTAGNLSTENANLNNAGVSDSLEFRTISGQIADIDSQAEYLRKEIDECRARNIITRCVKPKSEQLTGLMTEKRALQDRLLTVKPQIAEDEIFRRLSEFLQISTDQTKSLVFLLYSLLLDLGGAVLLVYGAGLLAFQTRDIWREAEMKTELEKQRLALEREKMLSSVSEKTDTGHGQDTRQDREPVQVLYSTVQRAVPAMAKRQDSQDTRQDTVKTDTRQDTDTGKIKHKIGYLKDTGQVTAQVNTGSQTGNPDKVSQYVTALYAGQKSDGSLTGRRKIGDLLGLSQQECDKIHTRLKRAGIVKVQGQKTFAVYSKDDALNMALSD